jgi:hypothetical protein
MLSGQLCHVHTFFVKEFLSKVHTGTATMKGSRNAVTVSTNTRGWYGEFKVWLNTKGIANLLSIPMLEEAGYIVSTHTQGDWAVKKPEGKKITFTRDTGTGVCAGMSYIDLHRNNEGLVMIETIQKKFSGATKREIEKAHLARTTQRRIGHPPEELFKEIVSRGENGIKNCPITVADINNSNIIYGPNRPRIKGATVKDTNILRVKEQRVAIPNDFYKMHRMMTITADVMFVGGIRFLVTYSRGIKFRTAKFVEKRTAKLLAKILTKVLMLYVWGGFIVNLALMDKESDAVKEHVSFFQVNTTAAREHVGEIERSIRTMKERTRCTISEFSFQSIPTKVMIYTVYNICMWLNVFPIISGIAGGFSPRELVTGLTINSIKHCKFDVGAYIEASTNAVITNDSANRTHPCIFLGPSGNKQGSLNCFDLNTGIVVVRRSAKLMVWPNILLKRLTHGEKREGCNNTRADNISKPSRGEI